MTARYLVLRTSQDTAGVPDRCRQWAQRVRADVAVLGPIGPDDLRARLEHDDCAGAVLELARVADDATVAAAIARAAYPVVAVSREAVAGDRSVVEAACAHVFAGRGTGGFVWGLWHLHALHEHPPRTMSYGPHPAQVADLRTPVDAARPVVVLVHGGFWRHEWERDLMDGLALDLSRRGYATWNVEYRRVGETGGGWPQTGDDVVRAVTALTILADDGVDLERVVLLGHSAGAQLALRAAAELRDRGRPPALVVALSGLLDLGSAASGGVGWGSVEAFVGAGPEEDPERYRDAAPIAHLPLGVAQLLAHGTADAHVPPAQSAGYEDAARTAGDHMELARLDDADHFAPIDPTSTAWATIAAAIERRVPPG
ncbi:MAG: alpha/beta hydrolase [Actinobacteria bacterium]|nr:alpha/beta hydrolase [Actinomycetota bacterium]